jgi:hypothetical protein
MSPRSEALQPSRESIVAAGHDLAMGLRAAYLTRPRRANAEFARLGLTADQFVILTALAEADAVTQSLYENARLLGFKTQMALRFF